MLYTVPLIYWRPAHRQWSPGRIKSYPTIGEDPDSAAMADRRSAQVGTRASDG